MKKSNRKNSYVVSLRPSNEPDKKPLPFGEKPIPRYKNYLVDDDPRVWLTDIAKATAFKTRESAEAKAFEIVVNVPEFLQRLVVERYCDAKAIPQQRYEVPRDSYNAYLCASCGAPPQNLGLARRCWREHPGLLAPASEHYHAACTICGLHSIFLEDPATRIVDRSDRDAPGEAATPKPERKSSDARRPHLPRGKPSFARGGRHRR